MTSDQHGLKKGRRTDSDRLMSWVLLGISSLAVLIVLLIIVFTLSNSALSFKENGLVDFLLGSNWRPSADEYGALPLIAGTLLVTAGAMAIAAPVGLACAIYISEIAPAKIRGSIKPVVELLSAIPSVVYGFIGITIFIPVIKAVFPDQQLFSSSWLVASIILGIMALPTVISVSEDALHAVPRSYREASLAMGATKWESITKVVVPAALSGISAAFILGIGRAIGETMAVLMLTGNSPVIPDPLWNVFSLISTLTGTIALQLPEAVTGSLAQSALFELGVILMIMVLVINLASKHIVSRSAMDKAGRRFSSANSLGRQASLISEHKDILVKGGFLFLMGVIIWMFLSLLTSDIIALIGALVVISVIGLLGKAMEQSDSSVREKICIGGVTVVMGGVILILLGIVAFIVMKGLPVIDWEFLTRSPEPGGKTGGIFPAIVGTLELIAGTAAIAFPVGIMTGIYLNEYARNSKFTKVIREAIDLLNGTPSIVFGMFGMVLFVRYAGMGYSLLAGWLTLAFMVLPVVIRTTEEALKAVPMDLREASRAMGATKWKTIYKVVLPAAMGGVVTGSILSIGRAAGETAPIMLTAAVISQPSLAGSIFDPVMALPLHLYHLAMDLPGTTAYQYGTATVLMVVVLAFFVVASLIRNHYNKKVRW